LKSLLQQSLSKIKKPKHLNSAIDIFAELAHLKKNEIHAKKHANKVESVITDLEVEVQSLREKIRLLQITVDENYDKKEKINRELEETLRVCDGMRNDLALLEDERNKLLISLDSSKEELRVKDEYCTSLSININRLEIKLDEHMKMNDDYRYAKIRNDSQIKEYERSIDKSFIDNSKKNTELEKINMELSN